MSPKLTRFTLVTRAFRVRQQLFLWNPLRPAPTMPKKGMAAVPEKEVRAKGISGTGTMAKADAGHPRHSECHDAVGTGRMLPRRV